MRTETERWLRYAGEDVETARVTLAGRRWAATSIHAQQAAEKALKAVWVEARGTPPPRIHDLVRLAEDAQVPAAWLEETDALSRAYLVSRYPADATQDELPYGIDEGAARGHLALAERILEWVQRRLSTASSHD